MIRDYKVLSIFELNILKSFSWFALVEAIALYGLVIAFIIMGLRK